MSNSYDIFSFGTLMDADLLAAVTGDDNNALQREAAVVKDHVALWVIDDHYPVLVPRPGTSTAGFIIRGLTANAFERIVFFEGGEFSVQQLQVINSKGMPETVAFFADADVKPVSEHIWTLEQWQHATKADTMVRVKRYMQCFGKMSIDEADAYW